MYTKSFNMFFINEVPKELYYNGLPVQSSTIFVPGKFAKQSAALAYFVSAVILHINSNWSAISITQVLNITQKVLSAIPNIILHSLDGSPRFSRTIVKKNSSSNEVLLFLPGLMLHLAKMKKEACVHNNSHFYLHENRDIEE